MKSVRIRIRNLFLITTISALSLPGAIVTAAGSEADPPAHATSTSESLIQPLFAKTEKPIRPAVIGPDQPPIDFSTLFDLTINRTIETNNGQVTSLAFTMDEKLLAIAYDTGVIDIFEVATGIVYRSEQAHEAAIRQVAFSPDGSQYASAGDDFKVHIRDINTGSLERTIHSTLIGRPIALEYTPDGSRLAVGGSNCYVFLYNTFTGVINRSFTQPFCSMPDGGGSVESWGLDFSTDGDILLTAEGRAGARGSIQSWPVKSYTAPTLVEGYRLSVRDLVLLPGEQSTAVIFRGSPELWIKDISDGTLIYRIQENVFAIAAIDISSTGLLVSGSRNAGITFWNPDSGERIRGLDEHVHPITAISFSPESSYLASADESGHVIIWSTH